MIGFRRRYGASPLSLVGSLAAIAVSAFALAQMFQPDVAPFPLNLLIWLFAGALLHDLVLLPGYSAADLGMRAVVPADAVNFVRFPLAISAVLFLVWFPRILDRQPQNYERALGHPPPDFLGRWLVCCGVLFAGSAILFAVRRLTAGQSAAARRSAP